MSEIKRYFDRRETGVLSGLNVAVFAEVIKIDLKYMRLDVKADMTTEELEDMPDAEIIMQVPIATHQTKEFVVRPPYQVGDVVLLVVSHHDIEPILFDGGEHKKQRHSLDDALVISGVTKFTEPLSDDYAEFEEDLIISKRDLSAKIVIKKDGEVIIESDKDINIKSEQNINIAAPNGIVSITDSRG